MLLSHVSRELLVHHVAKRLGVSRRTVRWWAATGRLEARKQGPKIWKFPADAVDEFEREFTPRRFRDSSSAIG
jgi:excisionase family DNA binding protein